MPLAKLKSYVCVSVLVVLATLTGVSARAADPYTFTAVVPGATLLWEFEPDPGGVFGLAAIGDQVFAAGSSGQCCYPDFVVRAIDAKTGLLLWQQRVERAGATAIAVSGDLVIAAGQSVDALRVFLQAYDRSVGTLVWQDQFDDAHDRALHGKIAESGSRVFVAGIIQNQTRHSLDFLVRAYDRITGTLLWQDQVGGPGSGIENEAWAWDIAAEGNRVFAVGYLSRENHLRFWVRAYDARNGTLLWEDQPGGNGDATQVTVTGGKVFVKGHIDSVGEVIRTYDAVTGSLLWEVRDNTGVGFSDMVVDGRRLFVSGLAYQDANDFLVRAYDALDGNLLWQDRLPGNGQVFARSVTASGGVAFAAGILRDSQLQPIFVIRAYDAHTGTVRWEDAVANGIASSVSVAGGRLFVGGDGDLSLDPITGILNSTFWIRAYDAKGH